MPQQRGLARARRPGQELERVRLEPEADVAQHFRPEAVAQADILEADHARPPNRLLGADIDPRRACCHARRINNALTIFGAIMAKSGQRAALYGFRFVNGPLLRTSAASPQSRAMLIVCPTCETAYQIERSPPSATAAAGALRACRNTWFATPEPRSCKSTRWPCRPSQHAAPAPRTTSPHGCRPLRTVLPPGDTAAAADDPFAVADAPPLVAAGPGRDRRPSPPPKFDPGVPDDAETIAAQARPPDASRTARTGAALVAAARQPADADRRRCWRSLLGALNWRAAAVRALPADRLALCGDRTAGEPARPRFRGREEQQRTS